MSGPFLTLTQRSYCFKRRISCLVSMTPVSVFDLNSRKGKGPVDLQTCGTSSRVSHMPLRGLIRLLINDVPSGKEVALLPSGCGTAGEASFARFARVMAFLA
jgi:hypothetical protein